MSENITKINCGIAMIKIIKDNKWKMIKFARINITIPLTS